MVIFSTGVMVGEAMEVGNQLLELGINAWVADIVRLKPFDEDLIVHASELSFVTLEEHYLPGGLGSIVAEILVDNNCKNSLLRIGVPEEFCFTYGGRQAIWEKYGLDIPTVTKRIADWYKGL